LEIGGAGLHNRPEAGLLEIECDTLDNILGEQRVDVMKIDIEGAEVSTLKGATRTLKKLRKIIVEVHGASNSDKVMQILERIHIISDPKLLKRE
jgi:hypothetical protein